VPIPFAQPWWPKRRRWPTKDVAINRRMGANGAALIGDGDTVIHSLQHGRAGGGGLWHGAGVIRCAHEQGKRVHVFVDETRPRLQGARLTAWELQQWGIPFTLIADGAAGHFLRQGRINLVLFGADRIAVMATWANKVVRTCWRRWHMRIVCRSIPSRPTSTVDLSLPDGDAIPIEERDARGDRDWRRAHCPARHHRCKSRF